jgi:hypothetical protein
MRCSRLAAAWMGGAGAPAPPDCLANNRSMYLGLSNGTTTATALPKGACEKNMHTRCHLTSPPPPPP